MKHCVWFAGGIRGTIVCSLIILLFPLYAHAQLRADLKDEVVVYIQPSAMDFPAGERAALPPDRITIHSQALRQAFSRFNTRTIARAFPDFGEEDTIRVLSDGSRIKLPQFSRIFRIRLPRVDDVDSAIANLSRLPGILYAEKNIDARLFLDDDYPYSGISTIRVNPEEQLVRTFAQKKLGQYFQGVRV